MRRLWRFLTGDEEATAVAELAILLPVYLVLLFALIHLGQRVLIRQQAVEAAWYVAWHPEPVNTAGELDTAFFGPFSRRGNARLSYAGNGPVRVEERDLDGADPEIARAAVRVLNNDGPGGDGPVLRNGGADVGFTYTSAWTPTFFDPSGTVQASARVLHRVPDRTRPSAEDGAERHPIEAFFFGPGQGPNRRLPDYELEWAAWETDWAPHESDGETRSWYDSHRR